MNHRRLLALSLGLILTPAIAARPVWVEQPVADPHPGGGWSWTVQSDPADNPEAALQRVELLAVAGLQNEITRRRGEVPVDVSVIGGFSDRWIADRYVGTVQRDNQTLHEAAWRVHLDESDLNAVNALVDADVRGDRVERLGLIAAVGLLLTAALAGGSGWLARRT